VALESSPYILYSDGKGNIFEDTTLYVAGRSGWDAVEVPVDEWIELPHGGQLYELPGRRGIGIDVQTGEMRLCEKGWAVAAFIPPAHTGLYLAAYEGSADAPTLPLFCYTTAGWHADQFYVPAVRVEQDIRQECAYFLLLKPFLLFPFLLFFFSLFLTIYLNTNMHGNIAVGLWSSNICLPVFGKGRRGVSYFGVFGIAYWD
jgi:hypothetical protein